MRGAYEAVGAEEFYTTHGAEYSNPHQTLLATTITNALDMWQDELGIRQNAAWRALDLACGGGEATMALTTWWAQQRIGRTVDLVVDACDPYTAERYEQRTGRLGCASWSFDDIAAGVLSTKESFDCVLASFCLHLLEAEPLHATLSALARASHLLIVATPHKRPAIEASTGWVRVGDDVRGADATAEGSTRHRVRLRLYRSQRMCRPRRCQTSDE